MNRGKLLATIMRDGPGIGHGAGLGPAGQLELRRPGSGDGLRG